MINLKNLSLCKSLLIKPQKSYPPMPIVTDTRKYLHPSLFVAIPGAKVNPLDVLDPLLNAGCPLIIYQDNIENQNKVQGLKILYPNTEFLPATDSVTFLQEISHLHIKEWYSQSPQHKLFAISGSNGKTTHKEMLYHILNSVFPGKIHATEKNNNNHLGVPLTLLQVGAHTEFVILELGSNHPGEIKVLCDIAKPNCGLTTNIGATHLEFFGSEEKVFEEEGYLYHAIKNGTQGSGLFLINMDDLFLKNFQPTQGSVTYGEDSSSQARVSYSGAEASIDYQGKTLTASNHYITGKHNKLNLITTLFIACHFFPEKIVELKAAAAEFRPTKNRSEWIQSGNKPIYLDAYNANPSSMKAALLGFKEHVLDQGLNLDQACVVMGDMNELGESSSEYHREVGEFVGEIGLRNVYFVGRFAKDYQQGFSAGNCRTSSADFKAEFKSEKLKQFSIFFIKGSRSLQLESLLDIT